MKRQDDSKQFNALNQNYKLSVATRATSIEEEVKSEDHK